MNRDRKDPVTIAFGVLLVVLLPTLLLLASRYQSLDERVQQLQPRPLVPAPSLEDLLAQVRQVAADSTLQLQPVWAAEPEPASGLVAAYQVVRGERVDTARFLRQFAGRPVAEELAIEANVDGISGATFSVGGLVEQLNTAAAWVREQPLEKEENL